MNLKQLNKDQEYRNKIREICTFHSNDSTSGYQLSEVQFNQIFDLIEGLVKRNNKEIRLDLFIAFQTGVDSTYQTSDGGDDLPAVRAFDRLTDKYRDLL